MPDSIHHSAQRGSNRWGSYTFSICIGKTYHSRRQGLFRSMQQGALCLYVAPGFRIRRVPLGDRIGVCDLIDAECDGSVHRGHVFVVDLWPFIAWLMIVRENVANRKRVSRDSSIGERLVVTPR